MRQRCPAPDVGPGFVVCVWVCACVCVCVCVMRVAYERPRGSVELRPCVETARLERAAQDRRRWWEGCVCRHACAARLRVAKKSWSCATRASARCARLSAAQEVVVGRRAAQHLVAQVDARAPTGPSSGTAEVARERLAEELELLVEQPTLRLQHRVLLPQAMGTSGWRT